MRWTGSRPTSPARATCLGHALLLFSLAHACTVHAEQLPRKPREWTWLYVMSYDNNLDSCTRPILDGLRAGLDSDLAAVAILSDRPDAGGLWQIGYTRDQAHEDRLNTDDITDPKVVVRFLDWAVTTYPARHYALVFLDHGGALDQMCADDHAGPKGDRRGWLSAQAMGAALTAWTGRTVPARLDLLFLQQCGRGSIENLFHFHAAASHLLASQTNVGACNTYYRATLALTTDPRRAGQVDGAAVSRQIMATDRHYTDYVLVRGTALARAPAVLGAVAEELMAVPSERFFLPAATLKPCFDVGPEDERGEANYDLLAYLEALYRASATPPGKAWLALRTWFEQELRLEHRFHDKQAEAALAGSWSGVAMHVPRTPAAFRRYAKLPLYATSAWGALASRIAGAAPAKAKATATDGHERR